MSNYQILKADYFMGVGEWFVICHASVSFHKYNLFHFPFGKGWQCLYNFSQVKLSLDGVHCISHNGPEWYSGHSRSEYRSESNYLDSGSLSSQLE